MASWKNPGFQMLLKTDPMFPVPKPQVRQNIQTVERRPAGSCSINEGNKSVEQKTGTEEARGWGGGRRTTRDHKLQQAGPYQRTNDKAVPAAQPRELKQAGTITQRGGGSIILTHGGGPAGGAGSLAEGGGFTGWTPGKRIPSLRWSAPNQLVVRRPCLPGKSSKGVQASGCQTPPQPQPQVSTRVRARAKVKGRARPGQHSSPASITAELSRRGSAGRWRQFRDCEPLCELASGTTHSVWGPGTLPPPHAPAQ